MKTPVIFLIFANQSYDPLTSLVGERKGIQQVFAQADKNNVLRCISESVTATQDILKTFDLYRGQIKILHFGGHATGDVLALADQKIQVEGLAELVKAENEIGSIELVFLNACATAGQVKALLQAGVKNVIATTTNVQDYQASKFAQQFYNSLMAGSPIKEAYQKAIALLSMSFPVRSDEIRDLDLTKGIDEVDQWLPEGALPWRLYTAKDSKADYVLEMKAQANTLDQKPSFYIDNNGGVINQVGKVKIEGKGGFKMC